MNYIKLQQDIIKAVWNDKTKNDFTFVDTIINERVWVIYKGIAIYSIPEKLFFIDRTAVENWTNKMPYSRQIIDNMMKGADAGISVKLDGTSIINSTVKCNRYENAETGLKVLCDMKLLKYSEPEYEQYTAKDDKMPMYVKDAGEVIAVILPIKEFKR